jgi:hypothetical protein
MMAIVAAAASGAETADSRRLAAIGDMDGAGCMDEGKQ